MSKMQQVINRRTFSIVVPTLGALLISCNHEVKMKNGAEDPFFISDGGVDSRRLPLIAPYEAISLNKKDGWTIRLFSDSVAMSVSNVVSLSVRDSLVYVKSRGGTYIKGSEVKEAWILINPYTRTERYFPDSTLFFSSVEKVTKLYPIDSVYTLFRGTGSNPWKKVI